MMKKIISTLNAIRRTVWAGSLFASIILPSTYTIGNIAPVNILQIVESNAWFAMIPIALAIAFLSTFYWQQNSARIVHFWTMLIGVLGYIIVLAVSPITNPDSVAKAIVVLMLLTASIGLFWRFIRFCIRLTKRPVRQLQFSLPTGLLVMPAWKFALLTLTTTGLYAIYWLAYQRKELADNHPSIAKTRLTWLAVLYPAPLLAALKVNQPTIRSLAYVVLMFVPFVLPLGAAIISGLVFFALVPAQTQINRLSSKKVRNNFSLSDSVWLAIGVSIIAVISAHFSG